MIARIALRYFDSPSAQPQSSDRVESRCTDIGRSSFDRTVRSELRFTCAASRGVVYMFLFFLDSVSPPRCAEW